MTSTSTVSTSRERPPAFRLPFELPPWVGLCTKFFSWEILSQGLRMIAALVIVRCLSKDDYAWYSLANNFWGAISLLSITGAGTGLMAMGGEFLNDKEKFAQVVKAASLLRLVIVLGCIPVAMPIFGYLLIRNGCPRGETIALLACASVVLVLEMSTQFSGTILSLRRDYTAPQISEIISGVIRLGGIVVLAGIGYLHPATIMLVTVSGMAIAIHYFLFPKVGHETLAWGVKVSSEIRKRFTNLTLNGFPTSLSLVFEGQIAMFLLAWFGTVENVADLGALGRLSFFISIPMAFSGKVLIPRMAVEVDKRRLMRLWLGGICYSIILGVVLVLCSKLGGHQMLWLLGSQYGGLEKELILYSGSLAFSCVTYQIATVTLAKGWMKHSWLRPVIVILFQCLAIAYGEVNTIKGAILLSYTSTAANLLLDIFLVFRGFRGAGHL